MFFFVVFFVCFFFVFLIQYSMKSDVFELYIFSVNSKLTSELPEFQWKSLFGD